MDKLIKCLAVLTALFIAGCSIGTSGVPVSPGRLSIVIGEGASRLLSPQTPMTVTKYIFTIAGVQTPPPVEVTNGSSITPLTLPPGAYSLTVDGFNASNLAIARAVADFGIVSGLTTTLTPVLTRLEQNGTLKLEGKTDGLGLASPSITGTLVSSSASVALTFTLTGNLWTLTQPVLPGSYKLTTFLKDGGTTVSTGMESVLILTGAQTYGGLSFHKENGILSSLTVNPPVVTGGGPDPVAAAPVISNSPAGAVNINTAVTATISAEPGAVVYYTQDGTVPTNASSVYSAPLTKTHLVVETRTIKAFAVAAGKQDSPVSTLTYSSKDPAQASAYYKTNPDGQVGKYKVGMNVTCVSTKSDGFSDWTPDMIIAQGTANDDAKSFYGGHEYPSYDSYALYAAWDDTNVYLGWQFVYVNDIANPSNNGGNEAKPTNADMPELLAFDTDSTKASIGTMATGKNLWYDASPTGFNFDLSLGVDKIAMFSSKGGVGQPSLFSMGADGFFSYTVPTPLGFAAGGIVYGAVDGYLPAQAWGVKKYPYVPADLEGTTGWVDFIAEGHNKSYDQFYEMKIPFTALGITKTDLETKGIGVMHVSIYGTSGVNSLPFDKTTLDNALLPYSKDSSTSNEKEDLDVFTSSLARIGKL